MYFADDELEIEKVIRRVGGAGGYREYVDKMESHREWYSGVVRYEQVNSVDRGEALGVVKSAVRVLTGERVSNAVVEKVLSEHAFGVELGARKDTRHWRRSLRNGKVGDYRKLMTRSQAQLLDDLLGDILVRQGYAEDRTWWQELGDEPGILLHSIADSTDRSVQDGKGTQGQ